MDGIDRVSVTTDEHHWEMSWDEFLQLPERMKGAAMAKTETDERLFTPGPQEVSEHEIAVTSASGLGMKQAEFEDLEIGQRITYQVKGEVTETRIIKRTRENGAEYLTRRVVIKADGGRVMGRSGPNT